jgi:hypothetical protein
MPSPKVVFTGEFGGGRTKEEEENEGQLVFPESDILL